MSRRTVPRTHLWALTACMVVGVALQLTHWDWFIEDAAISFAFARNVVTGAGGVAALGGERVEAVSNPTWIVWLMAFQAVGLSGFAVAKPLALGMGCVTTWVVWRIARLALPGHTGPGALLAPAFLALNSQHAIWSASGLENGWFTLLLAGLIWRTAHEAEHGGHPWAAVLALAIAWTRPDGLLYAAIAGAAYAVGAWRAGRSLRAVGTWLAVFWVPTALLEALRLWYFAWPLPNTYYAKISSSGTPLIEWDSRGWRQLRTWSDRLWLVYWAPVAALGLSGLRGSAPRWALGLTVAMALSVMWPGPLELQAWRLWPELPEPPALFVTGRTLALLVAGAALPLFGLHAADGSQERVRQQIVVLCGQLWFATLLFSLAADGDWMGGYRWMSLGVAPASVVLAVGCSRLLDALAQRVDGAAGWGPFTWIPASLVVGLWLPPNLSQLRDHLLFNHDETPQMIHRRVDYMRHVAQQTFHDGPIVNLDIDMGAFMWWAPEIRMLDIGKLIDVPLARHRWSDRPFVDEYVRDEHPFTFANLGINSFWARTTRIPSEPWFAESTFQLPGYTTARGARFIGIFARTELVMARRGVLTGPRRTQFEQELVLEDAVVPFPWTPGQDGYLELPWSTDRVRPIGSQIQVIAFLASDDRVVTWELPLGYGLFPMDGWRPEHVFRGKHAIPIPADLTVGTYDLGVWVLAPEGHTWRATAGPQGAPAGGPPRLAHGEILFPDAVEVVSAEAHQERTDTVLDTLLMAADSGACGTAEDRWRDVRLLLPRRVTWHSAQRDVVAPHMAACWAAQAEALDDNAEAADRLRRAHDWDPHSSELKRVGAPLAERLLADGRQASAHQDWDLAYRRYEQVLSFQPWRAWARRWAEEARDHRLGPAAR